MNTLSSNINRMERIKQGLGEREEHAPMLVSALRGCSEIAQVEKTFNLYRPELSGEGEAYLWKCDCLEEAMGVIDICGAKELSDKDRYKILEDLLVSGDWKE